MRRVARVRKTAVTVIGMAVTLVLLVPAEQVPERWRPWVGLVLAAGTIAGVYRVRNDPPPRPSAATSFVTPAPRQQRPRE